MSVSKVTTESSPPSLERLVEAMLFVGGEPLRASAIVERVRGVDASQVAKIVEDLNRRYKAQARPYHVARQGDGFVLTLRPPFQSVRGRMRMAARSARLSPQAIECLAIVAYRQPIAKAEIDGLRGHDSGPIIRQLVRHGLVKSQENSDPPGTPRYVTTPRVLQVFGLPALDELPRTPDIERW